MKPLLLFLFTCSSLLLFSCAFQGSKIPNSESKTLGYYDVLGESCKSGTGNIDTCLQMIDYAKEKKLKKAEMGKCPDMMEFAINPYAYPGFDWCEVAQITLPENTKDYGSGFRLIQTNLKSDVYYKDKLVYTFDHDTVLNEGGLGLKENIFFAPKCLYIDDTKKDTNGEKQDPIAYLSQDQVRGCVRGFISFVLSPYSFNDNLLQVSLGFQRPGVIIDLQNSQKHIINDDYAGSEYRQTSQYNFLIGTEGLTTFDRNWNKVGGLYFETELNPSMTIDTGTGDDMREDRYIYAKLERVEEKDNGNVDVTFKNGRGEEVIQKIILNGDFPPYKQRSKIITQESEMGKWVQAKELEEWEQNERVPLPVAHCDISGNCVAGNPPDKNSLEKFEVQFPHHDALAYFRDKAGFYSLSYRKNNDRPNFNVLKKIPDLIVVDGYIFEYDSKNILAFGGIPLSDAKNIQIRDDFLIDSKNVWNDSIGLATFDQVKDADPKTFRPLTNVGGDWSEGEYMIDKNHCYWFGWDKVNDSGVLYNTISDCNPQKLRYLGGGLANDRERTFSGGVIVDRGTERIDIENTKNVISRATWWDNTSIMASTGYFFPSVKFTLPENTKFECCGDTGGFSRHIILDNSGTGGNIDIEILSYGKQIFISGSVDNPISVSPKEYISRLSGINLVKSDYPSLEYFSSQDESKYYVISKDGMIEIRFSSGLLKDKKMKFISRIRPE